MIKVPDPLHLDRSVLQIFPDHTDKSAAFDTGDGLIYLTVTGFATVMCLEPGALPRIEVEPIVDEPDSYGLITAGDLMHETGWLLVEVQ